jgi:hypothetical protein
MSAQIGKALFYGYTPRVILNRIARRFPNAATMIYSAQAAGYTADTILRAISDPEKKGKKKPEDYLTEHEKIQKRGEKRKKRGALLAAGVLTAGLGAGVGLRALHMAGQAIRPTQILPALTGQIQQQAQHGPTINIPNPRLPYLQGQLPAPGQRANPQLPYNPTQPKQTPTQVGGKPSSPKGPTQTPNMPPAAPQVGMPPVQINPQQSVDLVKNLKEENKFKTILQGGHDPATSALILKKVLPKEKLAVLEKVEGGLEKVVEDYGMFLQSKSKQEEHQLQQQQPQEIQQSQEPHPNSARGQQLARQNKQTPLIPEVDIQEQEMIAPQFKDNQPQEERILPIKQDLSENIQISKEPEENLKKLAILPKGQVGTIESIKNGVAKLNVNGKTINEKSSNIKQEPEGIEEAFRYIVKSIPEKLKSSNLESIVHVPGLNLMLTQFYNGKWAWYTDFPEEIYKNIALGLYEPKTEGKTGIAEYKPGVIDSRGAGFDQEVKKNPKYSKENEGITWGYASNEYSLMHSVQHHLNKISKERYDENGNLIIPKTRKKSTN